MTRIRRSAVVSFVGVFGAAMPTSTWAEAPTINHDAVGCIVVDKFPRLEARFDPAENVSRGRLRFRPTGGAHWYSVPMKQEADSFVGVLPKPTPKLKSLDYYVEVTATDFATGRTREYTPEVVSGLGACQGDKIVAGSVGSASVVLEVPAGAPAVPAGFSSAGVVSATAAAGVAAVGAASGGAGGISTAAIVVGGVVVAGGAAAAVAAAAGGESAGGSTAAIRVEPTGTAIVNITEVRFSATSSDRSLTWDFGDGNSAPGQTVTHVYATEGAFNVTLRGDGGRSLQATTVSVGSLTGTWVEVTPGISWRLVITQQGSSLVGQWFQEPGSVSSPFGEGNWPLGGSVSAPRNVSLLQLGQCLRTQIGVVDENLRQISCLESFGNPNCVVTGDSSHTYRRQ